MSCCSPWNALNDKTDSSENRSNLMTVTRTTQSCLSNQFETGLGQKASKVTTNRGRTIRDLSRNPAKTWHRHALARGTGKHLRASPWESEEWPNQQRESCSNPAIGHVKPSLRHGPRWLISGEGHDRQACERVGDGSVLLPDLWSNPQAALLPFRHPVPDHPPEGGEGDGAVSEDGSVEASYIKRRSQFCLSLRPQGLDFKTPQHVGEPARGRRCTGRSPR